MTVLGPAPGTRGVFAPLVFLVLLFPSSLRISAQPAVLQVIAIQVGLSRSSMPDLNPKDVEASFFAIAHNLGHKRGYEVSIRTKVFERDADFESAMKRGEIQLAILDAWEYLGMSIGVTMEPVFVHAQQDRTLKEYLLLTRRQSGLNTLRDLRGKDVMILNRVESLLSLPWLEVLLGEERLGPKEAFFRKVESVQRPAAAVLAVFFGNRQACVVDRQSYQVMTEMNPQVGRELQVVASSLPFLNSIMCLSRKGWVSQQARDDLRAALRDLHLTSEGRQLLMMYQLDRLAPFQENLLASVIELRSKHKRLVEKSKP
jgi:ABC-type phosphate/phosphonate transport system substrate-binding protein